MAHLLLFWNCQILFWSFKLIGSISFPLAFSLFTLKKKKKTLADKSGIIFLYVHFDGGKRKTGIVWSGGKRSPQLGIRLAPECLGLRASVSPSEQGHSISEFLGTFGKFMARLDRFGGFVLPHLCPGNFRTQLQGPHRHLIASLCYFMRFCFYSALLSFQI